jgi:nitroimidazol reductase NimA-like FMN-containing flavoprotein (pyridoxamine 5'-phosphate oxidase superfamily)
VNETADDLSRLQALLDESDASAGRHLREVITTERRLTAPELCARLTGMRLLTLATVTSDGRPLTGPVDGVFYRGAFHFGSSPDSLRIRHIRQRPHVSATHLPGEELSVTVHWQAALLDMRAGENEELRKILLDLYTPRYGPDWESFLDANVRVRIDPDRMFTFHVE